MENNKPATRNRRDQSNGQTLQQQPKEPLQNGSCLETQVGCAYWWPSHRHACILLHPRLSVPRQSYLYYDFMSRDFFAYLCVQDEKKQYWLSPGANQYVRTGKFEWKATRCKNIAQEACAYQGEKYGWAARQKWREIYGTDFPN